MPEWLKGKDSEDVWNRAKSIIKDEYGNIEKSDSDRFYSLVTAVYKNICKSKDYDCGIGKKSESIFYDSSNLKVLSERIGRFMRIGNPKMRKMAVYDLGSFVRNIAGELAYKLADRSDPYGELAKNSPKVKSLGKKMIKAMEEFANAVYDTEKYRDIGNVEYGLGEEELSEKSQPKLNKYDPGSLLGWVVYLLEKEGLEDASKEVKKISKVVSQAWMERKK